MKTRIGILAIAMALGLAGCSDFAPFGDEDDAAATVAPNGCTAQGCPQAPRFCQARGYQPDTDAYRRCVVSVEQNLRKGQ
ncbi:MAG: hypothetical protein WDM86_09470 [Rhizomicrobium sp.]